MDSQEVRLAPGSCGVLICGAGAEVAEGEFEAAVVGMVILLDTKYDVERIARQHLRLLDALGHLPGERVVTDGAAPIGARR